MAESDSDLRVAWCTVNERDTRDNVTVTSRVFAEDGRFVSPLSFASTARFHHVFDTITLSEYVGLRK